MEQSAPDAEQQGFIELAREPENFDLAAWVMAAKKVHGKGYFAQLSEIRKLRRAPGMIVPQEYYIFRLYDDALFDDKAKLEFVGETARPAVYVHCNDRSWAEVEQDKLAASRLLECEGFATPRSFALLHPERRVEGVEALTTPEGCADYLRNGAAYPFFGKPLDACESVGVVAVDGYESDEDCVVLRDGRAVPVADFVAKVSHFLDNGYLFQERLDPHPEMAALIGDRLSTIRLMVRLKDAGPELYRCVWKIPVGDNVADNVWRDGNLMAAVDVATGTARRVVLGYGPDEREVEVHPDTGQGLRGAVVPDWERLKQVCLEAAEAFPGLRLQAWDVAVTPAGPVLLEINGAGDFSMPQRAEGRGMLDPEFREYLRSCRQGRPANDG